MESLIYSDTRLGRLGKCPLTKPSTPDPVYGRSIFRHGITTIRTCVHKLPVVEIICTATFIIPIQKMDESKSSVRNDLRRTGAEIIDFLVFRKFTGHLWRKMEV